MDGGTASVPLYICTVRMELGMLEDRESVESGEEDPPFYAEGDDEESVKVSNRTYSGSGDCSSEFALVPVENSTTTEMRVVNLSKSSSYSVFHITSVQGRRCGGWWHGICACVPLF